MPPNEIARALIFFLINYYRPKVVGPFPGPCASGSYMHQVALNLESHNACISAFVPLIFQCIGANAAFGVGEAEATCCKRQMVNYSRKLLSARGSQVFCRQFQFSQAVAIIVRLPTGGTTMALCSSHIRSPGLELSGHLKSMVHGACRWRLPGWGHGPPVCACCHTPGTTQAAPARAAMHDGIITISLSVCTLMWRVSPFATL
ncbi:unnamed protein product [Triticum turgidum subsp. durum]|uniref:Uncharacterized protein n=1 Tax=Triticum turgidum subsp. durum TaxID=4567 RepID=A0A9R0WCN7_TRITD|nr:unnamed protein product [Triticum turgidum subsp. durum]